MRITVVDFLVGLFCLSFIATDEAMAETFNFDSSGPGALPAEWMCGVTGSGQQLLHRARQRARKQRIPVLHGNGRRNTIKYVDAPVPKNTWHTLRVDFAGTSIKVSLNGKAYIDVQDKRIAGPGAVGMWTKADSVTAFDDFAFGASAQAK